MTAPGARIDPPLLRTAFVLVLGTFMATLDATIVAVGVDRLAEDFGAVVTEVQWVTTAYLLAVVASVPASGWLADRFGGRRVWLGALGVFLLGSALCAVAWSLPSLVVFRVVQGVGGGLLPPTGQALLARVAGPGRIGRLISVVGVVPLLSPVLGPLVGGTLLAVADWPWLFLVNLPIGVVAAVLAVRHVPSAPPSDARARFDLVGALLLAPGLAVLVLGTFMATLDATIVAVGVDRLAEDFGAVVTEVQWVTTAYLL
uniref:MFS transporter n=1 Tax=Actinosynnema sp. TaxID=1872144 RepID=UPI003F83D7E0